MQLVELQEGLGGDGGTAVVAISYDPVPVLAEFSSRHGITFPLLSDQGSVVMDELGLINYLTDQDLEYWGSEKQEKHNRLPFPGVFVLDGDGVIVEKRFERSHRNRASASLLIEALGESTSGSAAVEDEARLQSLSVAASVGQARVFPNQVFPIDLKFRIAEGMHIYVAPTPKGYQPLEVSVNAPDGVFWEPPILPTGRSLEMPELGETFNVVEDAFDARILTHVHEALDEASIEVVVRFQACDETSCELPSEAQLRLSLEVMPKM